MEITVFINRILALSLIHISKTHQQAEKEKKRYAEKGEHTFRQKVCKICGKPFWPSNGQEVLVLRGMQNHQSQPKTACLLSP